MQPLLHDSVSWLLHLFCWRKKQFKHLVSSSSVCSLNRLQALLLLLVGFTLFLRFARLQKPRIKLIVNFKDAVMTCDFGLCKSHLLSWWILHERKTTCEFYSLQYLLSLETDGKREGGKAVICCHLSSAEPDFRQINFGFVFIERLDGHNSLQKKKRKPHL